MRRGDRSRPRARPLVRLSRLLLLTAHRAKGLEFDHVAILDGGWDRASRGEDADAPRRLFYVAMTRARASLTLLASGTHPFVQVTAPAVLGRPVVPDVRQLSYGSTRFIPPNPKLVDLSHAGRLPQGHPTLAAIAAARVGDPISLRQVRDRWLIVNRAGEVLGRMSRAFQPPRGLVLVKAEIAAILAWRSEDGDEAYRTRHQRPSWEVVLPELVYGHPTAGDDAQKRPRV